MPRPAYGDGEPFRARSPLHNGIPTAVDGIFNAPTSGESWDNVVYLENLDRMAVIAVSREGITFRRPDGQATGPYFWDPAKRIR